MALATLSNASPAASSLVLPIISNSPYSQADVAASFQKAVTDVLVDKAMRAVEERSPLHAPGAYGLLTLPDRRTAVQDLHVQ